MNSPQTHLAFLTFKNLHTFPLTQPSHALQQLIQRSRRFSSSHLFSTSTKTLSKNSKPIRVMEVSPRDGLQNESKILPLELKLDLIQSLLAIKLTSIEVGSFVSPKWVPQMASTAQLISHPQMVKATQGVGTPILSCLIPNIKGLEQFKVVNADTSADWDPVVKEIALFASATEGFSQANLNCSVVESINKMARVAEEAVRVGLRVRGYVSCVFGCPYEGKVTFKNVASVSKALLQMGCYEVAISDTIGVAVPSQVLECLEALHREGVEPAQLGIHCHDTFGTSLANILTAVKAGVQTVDSSIGGIGGCPYSPGATGNVATEDVVYALESSGFSTGLLDLPSPAGTVLGNDPELLKRLEPLAEVGQWINLQLSRPNSSRVGQAVLARKARRLSSRSS